MSQIVLVTDRPTPVLELDDVKSYLKIEHNADDFVIKLLTDAAANIFEDYTNRILLTKTFMGFYGNLDGPQLRRGNFQSLISVQYLLANVWTDFDITGYTIDQGDVYPRLLLLAEVDEPLTDCVPEGSVRVTFKAGYGDKVNNIPANDRLAILQIIMFMFENRGDYDPGNLPMGMQTILDQRKIRSLR